MERSRRPKYYCVSMLPYPSGVLHMGHVRNYMINDMMYRQLRVHGYESADADGLGRVRPARRERRDQEQRPSGKWTHDNIATMKRQMPADGVRDRLVARSRDLHPGVLRWNQWLFLRMLERASRI